MESEKNKGDGAGNTEFLMGFTFAMYYQPAYQKRYGACKICHQGIEAGDKIMIGTGYFNGRLIKNHNHYDCWLQEVIARAKSWFFANEYKPKRMAPEQKAELNRLRAKRWYIQRKGGELGEIATEVGAINKQIALVKAG